MTADTRAVAPRTALDVDDSQVAERTARILKQRGSGLFDKDLSEAQAAQLARISLAHGLDPFLREITIFQGHLYVTIGGYIRTAIDHPQYDGMEEPRGPTDDERAAFRVADDEYFFVVRVWRKDRRFPGVGYGRARADEKMRDGHGGWKAHPVVEQYPAEMALKRAKMRALRETFALPLPVLDEDRNLPFEGEAGASGPIIEGVAREPDAPEMIRNDQVVAIHAIAHAIGWITKDGDDLYREALLATFGAASSKDLSANQAAAFIEVLVAEQEDASFPPRAVRAPADSPRLRDLARRMDDGEHPNWPTPAAPSTLAQLRTSARELGLTDLQLAGLIAVEYGEGAAVERLDERQAQALLALLGEMEPTS